MSSILSAQNLQTLRRRNSVRFLSSFLSALPPRPPRPPSDDDDRPRPSPRMCNTFQFNMVLSSWFQEPLHGFVDVAAKAIVVVLGALRAFARLPLGRQSARHAPPLRVFLAQGTGAIDAL